MQERSCTPGQNRTLVCVDSYRKGIPKGRFYSSLTGTEAFEGVTQFLLKMEETMDQLQSPQSYTTARRFQEQPEVPQDPVPHTAVRRGRHATFEIMVLFRQHTSWQGVVRWKEGKLEKSFRSVLELIRLMDSAMGSREGSGLSA